MNIIVRFVLRVAITVAMMIIGGRAGAAAPTDPSGTWLVEDGRARIRLERCGPSRDRLCGFIVWMKEPADKRARALLGHQLIMGLQATPEGQFAGEIYNAEDGKSYSVSLWRDSADRLKLRGCLIKFLCQTQTWQQTLDVLPGQLVGLTGDLNGPRADKEWAAVPAPKPMQAKAR